MDDMQEILEDFLIEAFELIEQLDQDLVELENNPEDLELLNSIFRVAHTIKGSSSFLNLDVLTELTHHMEDVLNKARKSEIILTPQIMDTVLESIDLMKALLFSVRDTGNDNNADINIAPTCAKLDAISKGEEIKEVSEEKEEIKPQEQELQEDYSDMSDEDVEAEIERLLQEKRDEKKKKKQAKSNEIMEENQKKEKEQPSSKPKDFQKKKIQPKENTAPIKKSSSSTLEQTIRVEVKRLDHLMNLIGELVLGKNRLLKIYDDVEERYEGEKFLEELNQVVSSVSLVTTDLQIAVMKTRMLPVAKVFNKFPRMVRDLSRELHKNIDLKISGEETELDKSIIEEIGDPLVHIIRNSCDHGIEDPKDREKAGKPENGTIELKAYNEGNAIVIEIVDDGKGLDTNMLLEKSLEKGIITEREADNMSEKEIFSLIFKPGFSTALSVTNVSGRGVGMDVVKTNIEKLNGIIDIDSELGKGTIIRLKIPLTLAIIQALLVGTQEEYFAIPLSSVLETVRVPAEDIYSIEGKDVLRLREEILPLVRLSDVFDIEEVFDSGENLYIVVIALADSKLGVVVDTLVGQEEIVIKSLGDYLKGIKGIAGATIRGDGRVTLIIDVGALMELARDTKSGIKKLSNKEELGSVKKDAKDYQVLIVDDSKTDRTIMQKALKPLDISITEATNGVEALQLIKSSDTNFDAILIDIEMPRMDGYTLAGEIRKYSRYKYLPLIAVTSRTSKSDRMRGVEVGMTEYITKPYSLEYLANVVKKNLKLPME